MVTVGFNGTYSVREGTGSINVCVFVLMNVLNRAVEVTISTQDGTARGKSCTVLSLQGSMLTIYISSCMQLGSIMLLYLEA